MSSRLGLSVSYAHHTACWASEGLYKVGYTTYVQYPSANKHLQPWVDCVCLGISSPSLPQPPSGAGEHIKAWAAFTPPPRTTESRSRSRTKYWRHRMKWPLSNLARDGRWFIEEACSSRGTPAGPHNRALPTHHVENHPRAD